MPEQIPDLKENLRNFFSAGIKSNLPFAIWRNLGEQAIHSVLQLDRVYESIEKIEDAPPSFIFSPFEKKDLHRQQFIYADVVLNNESGEVSLNTDFANKQDKYEKFIATLQAIRNGEAYKFNDYLTKAPEIKNSKSVFTSLVSKCIDSIAGGRYQKIVPSRRIKYKTCKQFHPVEEVIKLCEKYENAFISLVFIPDVGLWLGSTPELLMSVDDEKFRTISLAGTQRISQNLSLSKIAWTQKEIEEQALVSRYIVNCFKQIRLREFDERGPKTVRAGNLIHLKTIFEVDINKVDFPQLGSVMLDLLHPTSAVCGMPMLPVAKFIRENEDYDREYYSGFLGPVNYDHSTSIYVNLRCARVYKDGLVLFAGAGVTEDSNPEMEWLETEMKFQTLLSVLDN